jgi:hypothetical protein
VTIGKYNGGYVRVAVRVAPTPLATETGDLPACLCAECRTENVRFCRKECADDGWSRAELEHLRPVRVVRRASTTRKDSAIVSSASQKSSYVA